MTILHITPVHAQPSETPNIVLITVDNLGFGDLGAYGNTSVKTPELDRLAAQGVRLTSFYTAGATCTVSRAALLTGRYPQRNGLNHQLGSEENLGIGLRHSEILLPELLMAEGYATGAFGKWNIGFAPGSRPTERGFDEFYGHASGNMDFYTHVYDGRNDLYRGTEPAPVEGYEYSTDMWADAANDFIRRHADEPFFVYLPFNAVHYNDESNAKPGEKTATWQAPPRALEAYGVTAYDGDPQKRYWAMITAMDAAVGRVLHTLDSLDVADDTVVIWYSDNGAFMIEDKGLAVGSNKPLRNGGNTLWEGGIRVPAIIRWPGQIDPGTVSDEPLISLDLFTMAVEVAEAKLPRNRTIDGKNPIPTLTERAPSPHDYLFWQYRGMSAVRGERFKLMKPSEDEPFRLYDLAYDVSESEDVSDEYPEVANRLEREFSEWLETSTAD